MIPPLLPSPPPPRQVQLGVQLKRQRKETKEEKEAPPPSLDRSPELAHSPHPSDTPPCDE